MVALITGCGSETGIGFATALELGVAGYRVVITSTTERIHSRVQELQDRGVRASGVVGDLTDADFVASLVAGIGEPVAVLVNNAGMAALGVVDEPGELVHTSLAAWHAVMERNLTSVFLVTRACLPGMLERGYGRVVHHGRRRRRRG
jgi:3-oxoacyl-[acyl-carrier protein] reductase